MKQFNDKVSILVLDYNKPEESRLCLESVQEHCKFEKEVVFYSNGGEQDYAIDFYKEGLIDKLVLSKSNWGLGIGTTDLLQLCRTEFFIYLQNDQFFFREMNDNDLSILKYLLATYKEYGCISLAGSPCGEDIYSDRCHFGNTHFFRDMDKWGESFPDGGCGPYFSGSSTYNENFIQRYFKEHNLLAPAGSPFVQDNGKWSFRENADSSQWKHRTDTKELWLIKGPVKEKAGFPFLSDEEWDEVLETQKWEGKIPKAELTHSFKCWD